MTTIHALVRGGDLAALQAGLRPAAPGKVDARDDEDRTPLMVAVGRPEVAPAVVQMLLEHGADPSLSAEDAGGSVLAQAIRAGCPEKVRMLLDHGAKVRRCDENGYAAAQQAAYSNAANLLPLFELLIASGADLDQVSSYGESALSVLSHRGHFEVVALLLSAGADPAPLGWTALHRAVATGTLAKVEEELTRGGELEARDAWARTAWLLALAAGDLAKAELLRARGADTEVQGHCGKPPLAYAVASRNEPLLRWLLDGGAQLEARDNFGNTALVEAVEASAPEAVRLLLRAGASWHVETNSIPLLGRVSSAEVARELIAAGAEPPSFAREGRRALLGLPPEPDADLLRANRKDFDAGCQRQFGRANPELILSKYCHDMVRAGLSAWQARRHFGSGELPHPVWTADRFGQSFTLLPDGRIVQVGGEHEDFYDPDFCIYNDVFVSHSDGRLEIYAYPAAIFPPTDFHTATALPGGSLWIIGSLGYQGARTPGVTPMYCLDTTTWEIVPLRATGEAPGWIFRHAARALNAHEIEITGGTVVLPVADGAEHQEENFKTFVLNTTTLRWTCRTPVEH